MIDFNYLQKEYLKCFRDKSRIYMIQNYLKTYDATQKKQVKFNLFPRQQDLCCILGNANNVVTTKPRQAGITTTVGAFIACEMCLADPDSPQTVLVIGNTLDLAQQMVTKIREFLLQFPAWMWGDEYITDMSKYNLPPDKNEIFKICNQKELVLKNGCRVVARSSGPDASRGVGGVTWLIFDEAAFIENGKDVYASAIPTVSTGGKVVMVSTPNGKDQLYYETCRLAELKGTDRWNNFELVKMKWYQDPRYNKHLQWYRKNNEGQTEFYKEPLLDKEGNIKYDNEHWEKMVEDGWKPRSPWYITMCQQFNNDEVKIAQELDVSFLGSASNVVPPEAIEMQDELNVRVPLPKDGDGDMFHLEDTWIWKPPIPGHRYVMPIDCSRGDSDDRSSLQIIDLDGIDDDGKPCTEQVLEYNGKITGDDLGEMAYWYGSLYGNAFCIVESIGGYGDATILTLMRLGYKNLYYDDPNLNKYTIQREQSTIQPGTDGKLPGFHSNAVRFQMLSHFANAIRTNEFKVRSRRVISELDTWIFKNGRQDHQDGCHDDNITCLAMGYFVVKFYLGDMERAKERDAAFLRAWINSTQNVKPYNFNKENQEISAAPKKTYLPIYNNRTIQKVGNTVIDSYRWLLV
jgi:hypothetical protein